MYTVTYTFTKIHDDAPFPDVNNLLDRFIFDNFPGKCLISNKLLDGDTKLIIKHVWLERDNYLEFVQNSEAQELLKTRRTYNSLNQITSTTEYQES